MLGWSSKLVAATKNMTLNWLPYKSRKKYEFAYKRFLNYCYVKNMISRYEDVIMVRSLFAKSNTSYIKIFEMMCFPETLRLQLHIN